MILKLPYNCDSVDLFIIPGCSDIRIELLDNFELFAFQTFSNLEDTNLILEEVY